MDKKVFSEHEHALKWVSDHLKMVFDHLVMVSEHLKMVSDHLVMVSDHLKLVFDHLVMVSDHLKMVFDHSTIFSDHSQQFLQSVVPLFYCLALQARPHLSFRLSCGNEFPIRVFQRLRRSNLTCSAFLISIHDVDTVRLVRTVTS